VILSLIEPYWPYARYARRLKAHDHSGH